MIYIWSSGHLTKITAMLIYVKNSLKIFFTEPEVSWLWNLAHSTWALQSLYKWWSGVDIDLFYNKVNFVHLGFYLGKICPQFQSVSSQKPLDRLKSDLKQNICALREHKNHNHKSDCNMSWSHDHDGQKNLLLKNHRTDWSQISYGISMPRGNKSLYNWSWSQDQDGRHGHIWKKTFKNLFFSRTISQITLKLAHSKRALSPTKVL